MDTAELKRNFLKEDLYHALKELFIAAVTWQAHPQEKDTRYLRDIGMYACFLQARALYEFFYTSGGQGDLQEGGTVRARHFTATWMPQDEQGLYNNYMARGTPAQKRAFHLVYGRGGFLGGSSPDESDHLKNQVMAFAKDLLRLTRVFAQAIEQEYRALVEAALQKALRDAKTLAEQYGIEVPFEGR